MKIAEADYMPVSKIPSDLARKDQTGSLYSDGEELKKVRKISGCPGYFSMADFKLTVYDPAFKFRHGNLANYAELNAAMSYASRNKDRGFKAFVGCIVDTLV